MHEFSRGMRFIFKLCGEETFFLEQRESHDGIYGCEVSVGLLVLSLFIVV